MGWPSDPLFTHVVLRCNYQAHTLAITNYRRNFRAFYKTERVLFKLTLYKSIYCILAWTGGVFLNCYDELYEKSLKNMFVSELSLQVNFFVSDQNNQNFFVSEPLNDFQYSLTESFCSSTQVLSIQFIKLVQDVNNIIPQSLVRL